MTGSREGSCLFPPGSSQFTSCLVLCSLGPDFFNLLPLPFSFTRVLSFFFSLNLVVLSISCSMQLSATVFVVVLGSSLLCTGFSVVVVHSLNCPKHMGS